MFEVYSILCMYCNIQLITNIIDLIQKLVCIPDLDKIDFDLICHKIDKSDKGELYMHFTNELHKTTSSVHKLCKH